MKNRKLKVRAGYYDRPYTGRTSHPHKPVTQVPFVLLKGQWLEQANFLVGQPINVEVRENQLILTTDPSWTFTPSSGNVAGALSRTTI